MYLGNFFGQVFVVFVILMMVDGEVDWFVVEKYIDDVIIVGVDGIVVMGMIGEILILMDFEKFKFVEVGKFVLVGCVKIIIGGGFNEIVYVIELYKVSEKVGVDGIMIVMLYYNKLIQVGILMYFWFVVDVIDFLVIFYDIFGCMGVLIKYEMILCFVKYLNIFVVKDVKGDFFEVSCVFNQIDFMYFFGDDVNVLLYFVIGVIGFIGVMVNVVVVLYCMIIDVVNVGDLVIVIVEYKCFELLVCVVMMYVLGMVVVKYILYGFGCIMSLCVCLFLVGFEEWEVVFIEDEFDFVKNVFGVDFLNF